MNIKSRIEKLKFTLDQIKFLEEEYMGKKKGNIYLRRHRFLREKTVSIISNLKNCGRDVIYKWEMKIEMGPDLFGKKETCRCFVSYPKAFTEEDVLLITTLRTGQNIIEIKKVSEIDIGFLEISE